MEMETVVAAAIGILATVFLASLVGLILVCRHKFCRRKDLISQQLRDNRYVWNKTSVKTFIYEITLQRHVHFSSV